MSPIRETRCTLSIDKVHRVVYVVESYPPYAQRKSRSTCAVMMRKNIVSGYTVA